MHSTGIQPDFPGAQASGGLEPAEVLAVVLVDVIVRLVEARGKPLTAIDILTILGGAWARTRTLNLSNTSTRP